MSVEQLNGWEWNESLAQYERGDFRVVKYKDDGREYCRLLIRCEGHPELDGSAPIELEYLDVVCQTLLATCKERTGIELKY